jgi:hypothetical protein
MTQPATLPSSKRPRASNARSASANVVEQLLRSPEPSIRYKVRVGVLGESESSRTIRALRREIRSSPRVAALLAGRARDGRLLRGRHPYAKWYGAHWVMATLADLGYPPGDRELAPIRDQLLDAWLAPQFYEEFECSSKAKVYSKTGVPVMRGRHRRCASQQGNALYAIVTLGLADKRTEGLVERLLYWQWPDGGWNCDKDPVADSSSFMETLTPMRGLAAYARQSGDDRAREATVRAAGIFLDRQLFKRRSTGATIRGEFVKLHYPLYWHYDILGGLKVMAESGMIRDERCRAALDVLASKRLPDGGFPAEARHYRVSRRLALGVDVVDWGGTSKRVANPWVTADALVVLAAAGLSI